MPGKDDRSNWPRASCTQPGLLELRAIPRDLLAVVVELLESQRVTRAAARQRIADQRRAALDLGVAFFHRQLEVEDRALAGAFRNPRGDERGDARGLLDDVTDHPVDGTPRP